MKRDLARLADESFDVLVIGGGIYGAWAVWDATLRGFSAALVERGDFGSGTSSSNFKLVHGGLRYLQHLDLKRMRESIREQRTLRRVAPHLVHPMPCLVPTYGRGLRGRAALGTALFLNDLVSFDRNRGIPAAQRLAGGQLLSAAEVRDRIPGVPDTGLTGGAMWHDAQMRSPDRLLLGIVRAAAERGAVVANYVDARRLIVEQDRVVGAEVRDVVSGDTFPIRARVTLNCAGPSVDPLLEPVLGPGAPRLCPATQAWNLVLGRLLVADVAVGLYSSRGFRDSDRKIARGGRLIFLAPWRGRTMIGTSHRPLAADREGPDLEADRAEMLDLLEEAADAYPAAELSEADVAFAHCGVLPGTADPATGDVRLAKHFILRDHAARDGIAGLITCVGVKFTTARDVAERVVRLAARKLDRPESGGPRTSTTPIDGGDLGSWEEFSRRTVEELSSEVAAGTALRLVENHGTRAAEVVRLGLEDRTLLTPLGASTTIGAEVVHAVRSEMALGLIDLVRRRTDLGSAGLEDLAAVEAAASVMGSELGWSAERLAREVDGVRRLYRPFCR